MSGTAVCYLVIMSSEAEVSTFFSSLELESSLSLPSDWDCSTDEAEFVCDK